MIPGIIASSRKSGPVVTYVARDRWLRTATGDWGQADVGGTWVHWGASTGMTVDNGTSSMTMGSGAQKMATLPVSQTSAVMRTWFSWDATYGDAVQHCTIMGRAVGAGPSNLQARVRVEPAGVIRLRIQRDETELGGSSYVHPTAYTAGKKLHVMLEVSGVNPTTIRAKLWMEGESEPTGWSLSGTDSTAGYQTAGAVGLRANLGASAGGNSRTITWGPLEVTAP